MANYLLTGSAGFIASRVATVLLAQGDTVHAIDNLNDAYDVRLKLWRLEQLRPNPCFRFTKLDISDKTALNAYLETVPALDGVINLAARAGVRQSIEDPWIYLETNATGTLNLLEACRHRGIPKFVLASTSSLYGNHNPVPFVENADTNRPISPYAASKKAAEALCAAYHALFHIDVSIFRYFTVYGPAGRPDMSLFRFVQWIHEGRPVKIFGDGRQSRDFTYVDDIARGTVAGLRPLGFAVINLGSDHPVLLMDTIRIIERLSGKRANLEFLPAHPADVSATWADINKAREELGWQPCTKTETGIANLVRWYQDNRDWASQIRTN